MRMVSHGHGMISEDDPLGDSACPRECSPAPKKGKIQWIGLRENLQETMVFTIKYRGFL